MGYRYKPNPNTVTWPLILEALKLAGCPLTTRQLVAITGHTTCGLFLPHMVEAGVVAVDRSHRPFWYSLRTA